MPTTRRPAPRPVSAEPTARRVHRAQERTTSAHSSEATRTRLLDAAEQMFLDYGFDGSTLRRVTTRAAANIASANYHFGGKDQLFTAMLARRLDPMNAQRRALLASRESASGPGGLTTNALTTEAILSAMFVPALALARESRGAPQAVDFLRLLGRAYVDPSPVVRNFLSERYSGTIASFKDAFSRALPHLSRQELSWRLHFTLGALSYTLAGGDAWKLIDTIQGDAGDDERLLARLTPFLIAGLQAPVPDLGATRALLANASGAAKPHPSPHRRAA